MSEASPLTPARRRAQELAAAGDLAAARELLEKAVELGKANLAEDDPDVLLTAYHLAQIYQRLDDHPSARRVLEDAYAAGQWRLGDHDPLMVEISHDIGVVAEELGNRHEARKAFTRVAEYGPAALGANHEAVTRAQAYLGHAPDSVRSATPATATPAAPGSSSGPNLTLVTPVPTVPPFGGQTVSPSRAEPPPPIAPVWTPAPRRSPEALDEPTIAQPVITPRREPAEQIGRPVRPAPRPVPQQWAPPPPHHLDGAGAASPAMPAAHGAPTGHIAPTGDVAPAGQFTPTGQHSPAGQYTPTSQHSPAGQYTPTGQHSPAGQYTPTGQHMPAGQFVPSVDAGAASYSAPIGHLGPANQGATGSYGTPFVNGVPTISAAPGSGGDVAYRKRSVGVFAAVAAVLASVVAVVALVLVLANRGDDGNRSASASDVPTLAGDPPADVRLRDRGAEIELSWKDPTSGTVSFMVVMAHPGEELKPMATLGPGKTSYRAGGLSTSLNYCFAVVAVYKANQFATSPESCTSRGSAGSGSSTGK